MSTQEAVVAPAVVPAGSSGVRQPVESIVGQSIAPVSSPVSSATTIASMATATVSRTDVVRGLLEGKTDEHVAQGTGVPVELVTRMRADIAHGVQLAEPAQVQVTRAAGDVAAKVIDLYFDKRREATQEQAVVLAKQTWLAVMILVLFVAGVLGLVVTVGYYRPESLEHTLLGIAALVYLVINGGNDGGGFVSKLFRRLLS